MLNVPDEFSVRPSSRIDPEIGITDTTEAELQKLDERIGNPPAGCNRKLRRHRDFPGGRRDPDARARVPFCKGYGARSNTE